MRTKEVTEFTTSPDGKSIFTRRVRVDKAANAQERSNKLREVVSITPPVGFKRLSWEIREDIYSTSGDCITVDMECYE